MSTGAIFAATKIAFNWVKVASIVIIAGGTCVEIHNMLAGKKTKKGQKEKALEGGVTA